jgi:hypothetical protein
MMDIGESDVDKDQLLNLLMEALTGKTSADLRHFLATVLTAPRSSGCISKRKQKKEEHRKDT